MFLCVNLREPSYSYNIGDRGDEDLYAKWQHRQFSPRNLIPEISSHGFVNSNVARPLIIGTKRRGCVFYQHSYAGLQLHTSDDNFEVSEGFVGFYELSNIKSETIVNSIKDISIRCHLSLDNCRGQTYDGASNMMGKRSGVSAKICREQPKAKAIHC